MNSPPSKCKKSHHWRNSGLDGKENKVVCFEWASKHITKCVPLGGESLAVESLAVALFVESGGALENPDRISKFTWGKLALD